MHYCGSIPGTELEFNRSPLWGQQAVLLVDQPRSVPRAGTILSSVGSISISPPACPPGSMVTASLASGAPWDTGASSINTPCTAGAWGRMSCSFQEAPARELSLSAAERNRPPTEERELRSPAASADLRVVQEPSLAAWGRRVRPCQAPGPRSGNVQPLPWGTGCEDRRPLLPFWGRSQGCG